MTTASGDGGGDSEKIRSSHDVLHGNNGESEVLSSSVDADLKKRVEESTVNDVAKKIKRTNDEDGASEQKRKKIKTERLTKRQMRLSADTTTTSKHRNH